MGRICSTNYGLEDFGRKLEVKTPLGRPRRRWEDNIETDLREMTGRHGLDPSGSG
jgi:hypothetical protein